MKKLCLIIAILFVIIVTALVITKTTYEKFNLIRFGTDSTEPCKVYYEKCTCYGAFSMAKSYPPQYLCVGMPICKSLFRDEPEGCSQE